MKKSTEDMTSKEASEEIGALFLAHGYGATHSNLGVRTEKDTKDGWCHTAWLFRFNAPTPGVYGKRALELSFRTGMAHKAAPDASEVLACWCRDASEIDGITFEEWAENNCMNPDSRKAERTFKDITSKRLDLIGFLGTTPAESETLLAKFAALHAQL